MVVMTHNDEDGKGSNKMMYIKERKVRSRHCGAPHVTYSVALLREPPTCSHMYAHTHSSCPPPCTQIFRLHLALAFYGENLNFVSGVPPPPAPAAGDQFDIVDLKHVNRVDAAAWTLARANAHFGEF